MCWFLCELDCVPECLCDSALEPNLFPKQHAAAGTRFQLLVAELYFFRPTFLQWAPTLPFMLVWPVRGS